MGAGQSDLYKGTYGDKEDNIPNYLKGKVKLPTNDSQLKHIFDEREGHISDTPENRKMLKDLANDGRYYMDKDKYGNDWHVRMNADGSQDWTRSQHQVINEGGKNIIPKPWNKETGLYRNPTKRRMK